jgi:hypothetical protein
MPSKGLKGGSLGLVAVIVIGVASTAPGYSLAASIGLVTDEVGVKAPFIMLFAFVPMACIAASLYYLNKARPCRRVIVNRGTRCVRGDISD